MNLYSFGEILFDVFENGDKTLGGSPFNQVYHYHKLSDSQENQAFIISSIGKDDLAKEVLSFFDKQNIRKDFVKQVDFPTGYVNVKLAHGNASYEIIQNVAWDYIDFNSNIKTNSYFSFASLALRSSHNRETVDKILRSNFKEIFFDVNLRKPFYEKNILEKYISKVSILKINEEEIIELKNLFNLGGSESQEIIKFLSQKFLNLKIIILTLGSDGVLVFYQGEFHFVECVKVPKDKIIDTIGAGDSFCAAFLFYLEKEGIIGATKNAVELAAKVVQNKGAIFSD